MIKKLKKRLKEEGQIYLRLKVLTNASQTEFKDIVHDDMIKINLAAVPERGRANKELIKFLAKEFRVDKKNIKIISGVTSRLKLVKIHL